MQKFAFAPLPLALCMGIAVCNTATTQSVVNNECNLSRVTPVVAQPVQVAQFLSTPANDGPDPSFQNSRLSRLRTDELKETPPMGTPASVDYQNATPYRVVVRPSARAEPGNATLFQRLQAMNAARVLSDASGTEVKMTSAGWDGSVAFDYTDPAAADKVNAALIQTLAQAGAGQAIVEPAIRMFPQADPLTAQQWHYRRGTGVNAMGRHDPGAQGEGVVVAVLDTGVVPHPDLGNLLPGYDFISNPFIANDGGGRDPDATDPGDWVEEQHLSRAECSGMKKPSNSSWHGTHVAGTIAALDGNGIGGRGVAPKARILPVRVLGRCGGDSFDIENAIAWSAGLSVPGVPDNPHPAQVINLSLGGLSPLCSNGYRQVIEAVRAKGVSVVVAAGNSNTDASLFSPANCTAALTVAAVGPDGMRAGYSNFGAVVDVAAPGGDQTAHGRGGGVLSTIDKSLKAPSQPSYGYMNGTSMATPHVAGVLARLIGLEKAERPNASPVSWRDQAEAVLEASLQAFPGGDCANPFVCGKGLVDFGTAAQRLRPDPCGS